MQVHPRLPQRSLHSLWRGRRAKPGRHGCELLPEDFPVMPVAQRRAQVSISGGQRRRYLGRGNDRVGSRRGE
ncbi:hypothetical protein C1885_20795 [Pseudomonas sp. GW531-R1]|nr:hypothetical protein C1885_20795 [Pseudomonas sp. GW531-R1]